MGAIFLRWDAGPMNAHHTASHQILAPLVRPATAIAPAPACSSLGRIERPAWAHEHRGR